MEFNEKLQELRKQKGLTQEELAERLYVSRTAVSKWESGRGYPNIGTLKAIAALYSVTVDELLSGEELLTIAEHEQKRKETYLRDVAFGLLDISVAMLLFLPLFGQPAEGGVAAVSLLSLTDVAPYMRLLYLIFVVLSVVLGVCTLGLQNCRQDLWVWSKGKLSLALSGLGVLLFILSPQPYAAAVLFVFLIIKVFLLMKRH